MEVYAAMVDRLEQGIGRVLAALDETGLAQNTIVFFLSDNGGSPEASGPPRGGSAHRWRGDQPHGGARMGLGAEHSFPPPQGMDLRGRCVHALHRPLARTGRHRP